MPNQNGRTTHRDEHLAAPVEHGYQDPRDQRDREQGRDDFRGLDSDRDERNGDRYAGGNRGWSQGGDQYAERDRNMYDRSTADVRNNGQMGRDHANDRGGQSGAQAGRYGANQAYRGQGTQGGSPGHWGDMDQGGRYQQRAQTDGYDSQAPQYGAGDPRSADHGEQRWGQQQRGPHAGKGPQGFQRSDERIKDMVHEALTDDEHLDATHISVDVNGGEVTLSGTVDDRQAKRRAEDVVERLTGVKDVTNQIRVQTDRTDTRVETKTQPS